jgi:hypothetical protein
MTAAKQAAKKKAATAEAERAALLKQAEQIPITMKATVMVFLRAW